MWVPCECDGVCLPACEGWRARVIMPTLCGAAGQGALRMEVCPLPPQGNTCTARRWAVGGRGFRPGSQEARTPQRVLPPPSPGTWRPAGESLYP